MRFCRGKVSGLHLIGRRIRRILKHLLDVAGAENRVEVVTVGLMVRRRYFVKQGNLLSLIPFLGRALGNRDGYVSKELGFHPPS